jgi:hypothetical protein
LQAWVEAHGIETLSIRIVHDRVAGVSPAFGHVELKNEGAVGKAVAMLNGNKMRNQTVFVKQAAVRAS